MAVKTKRTGGTRIPKMQASSGLTQDDYRHLMPEFDRLVNEQGRLRVLFEMVDLHRRGSWAVWDNARFDSQPFLRIERYAIVAEKV